MAAVITANTTAASVSQVRPRLSVSVVNAKGTATASVAASSVEYIELAVGASLDTTGKFKFVSEIVLMLDSLRIDTSKRLSDAFAIADRTSLEAQKALAHSIGLDDRITSISTAKQLADATGVPDHIALAVGKVLTESFAVGDARAITAGKALADAFGLTDSQQINLQKTISDSVSLTETFYLVLVFIRNASDMVSASDAASILVSKAPFGESVFVADESARTFSKSLSDGVAMNDGTSVGDGSTFYFEKNINNIAAVTDASSLEVQKATTDSFGASDSGLLVLQGYCDITYFSEDYVGTSTSF